MRTLWAPLALLAIAATMNCSVARAADSAWCKAGTVTVSLADGTNNIPPEEVLKRCQPGDSVMIDVNRPYFVAMVCDFTQAIVVTPVEVVCIVGPGRTMGPPPPTN